MARAQLWRSSGVRALTALTLAAAAASTGIVTLAGPALGDVPAPTVRSEPTSPSTSSTPTWTFDTSAGSAWECSVDPAPATSPAAWQPCGTPGPTSDYTPTLTTDGDWVFSVRQVVSGDIGLIGQSATYTRDTVATATVSPASSPTNDTTPSWLVTPETPTSTATCQVPGMTAAEACSGSWTTPVALPEGTTTLTVAVTDDLGNTGVATADVVIDLTAPATPTPTPSGARLTNDPTVTWTWSAGDAVTATCTLLRGGTAVVSGSCGPLTSYVVTVPSDGTYALQVALTDAAGNAVTGTSAALDDVVVDTTPTNPPVLVSGPTAGRGTATSADWTFTTPGVTTRCTLSSPGQPDRVDADCQDGVASFSGLTDGTWSLEVTTYDGADNPATLSPSPTWTVDTTGPTAPSVTGPAGLTNVPAATYAITPSASESGTTTQCRLVGTTVGGTVLDPTWGDCTATGSLDVTLAEDGTYRVEARLVDDLGNVGATGVGPDVTYDGTPPDPPDLSGVPAVTNTVPTLTVGVEPGGSATCVLSQGGAPLDSSDCSTSPWTPPILAQGSYTLTVTVRDGAGNAVTRSTDVLLDTTPPDVPQLTVPTSPSSERLVSWGIVGDGTPLTCTLTPTVITTPTACTNGLVVDLTGQPDGVYTLTVTATDPAGNSVTATDLHELDTTAPAAPDVAGPDASGRTVGNAVDLRWTFLRPSGTQAQCRLVQDLSVGAWTACNDGTYDASGLPDATYVVEVELTDLAGNTSTPGASTPYRSDRTAPLAPVLSGPTGPAAQATVTWTWTGEAGTQATCRLDRDGTPGLPTPCGPGTLTVTLPADGSYQLVVSLTDDAGNTGAAASLPAYLLDRVAPVTPVVTGPSGPGNDPRATWTFPIEAAAAPECRLVQDGTAGPWTSCASGDGRTLTADGNYQLQVRQTDAAGNTSPVGVSPVYAFDATAPAVPSVVAPASPSSQLLPTWAFSSETGSAPACRVVRASALVDDWKPCTSPFVRDLTGLPDGPYVLQVRVTDPAGNVSPVGESAPYAFDTTAPETPVVTGPSGPSPSTSPVFTWTAEAGTGSVCRLQLDGVLQGTGGTSCFSPYSPPAGAMGKDGLWVLTVQVLDLAGNRSAVAQSGGYVLDTTAPAAPVVVPPTSPGRTTSPSWSATVEAGATTECQLTSRGNLVRPFTPCQLPVTTDLPADGPYTLSVRATDAAGLTSKVASADYVLDTLAPVAPVFTTTPTSPGRTRSVAFGWTAEAGAVFTCRLSVGPKVLSTTACTSPATVTLTNGTDPLPDGAYTLAVVATDAAGNAGPAATSTYVLDTTPPAAPVLLTGPAAISPDRTPTWSFSAVPGVTFTCKVTSAAGTTVADGPCTSPYTPAALPTDDTWTLTVRAADAAGNSSAPLSSSYVLSATAPVTADVVGPSSPGRSTLVAWQVSATSGTVQCRLLKGTTVLRDWRGCGPTYSATLVDGDGSYALAVRVVDAKGVASSEVVSRYVLDTVGPPAALLTAPTSPGTDRGPTWTVATPEAGASAQCSVVGPTGAPLKAYAACPVTEGGAPYRLDLTGAVDGSYRLLVRLTDQAGNGGAETASTYVLDTGQPNTVLVTAPASPGNSTAPVWQLVGDTDATLECRFTGPGITGTAFAPCATVPGVPGAGSFTAQLTVTEGTFVLTVRSRDDAGNLGPETTSSYTLDAIPPAAPTVPMPPRTPDREPTIAWTFTVEPGSVALCTLSLAAQVQRGEQECTSPFVTDLQPFGDGSYTLSVRARDAAFNYSPTVSGTYVLDRKGSDAPVIVAAPANRSPDTTPTWRVALSSPGDVLECQLLGLPSPAWAPCSTPVTFDLAPATSGVFQLQARERDVAGNVSPIASSGIYTLDASAPWTVEIVPPDPQRARTRNPVFQIVRQAEDTTTAGLVCAVSRFDGVPATVTPCAPGPVTLDLNVDPPITGDGDVVLTVRAVTADGQQTPRTTGLYHYDDVPAAVPALLAPAPDHGYTSQVSWSFGTTDENDRYLCRVVRGPAAGPGATDYQPCTSPLAMTLGSPGAWTFEVASVDQVGNTSLGTLSSTYRYLAPVPSVLPRGPVAGGDATPTWTFPVPRGLTAACSVTGPGGVSVAQARDCSTGTFSIGLPDVGGSYTLAVVLGDGYTGGTPGLAQYLFTPPVQGGFVGSPVPVGTPNGSGGGGRPRAPRPVPGVGPSTPGGTTPTPPRGTDTQVPRGPGRNGPSVAAPGRGSVPAARPLLPTPDLNQVPSIIGKAITDLGRRPTIPLVLLSVVVGFLLLQNRIDRRDPKLAEAPVGAEPELEFGPVLGRRTARPAYPVQGAHP